MSKYQPYPEYKNSGTTWLGDLPCHWQVLPTKRFFKLVAEPAPQNNNYELLSVYTEIGVKPRKELEQKGNKASTTDGYWQVKKGDIIVNKLLAWMGAVGYSAYNGVTSPAYDILRPTSDFNTRFYHYLFRSEPAKQEFKRWSRGIMEMRLRLYFDELGRILMPFPPKDEIEKITAFLDHETAKIDTLIEKQQQLIELLKEKRQAVISHAVTKGLNPDAPMKDSGVEWLGEVPEHWIQLKLKHVVKNIIDAEHKTAPYFDNGDYLVCRTTNVRNGKLLLDGGKYTNKDTFDQWTQRAIPEEGDILFTREAPAGEACVYDASIPLCLGQRMVLFKLNKDKMLPEFVLHSLYSGLADDFIKQLSQGSTVSHFNMADIQNIPLFEPPFKEQLFIIEYLKKIINKYDAMSDKAASAILLMQERRTALISAAVTGKIDVRHFTLKDGVAPTTSSDTNEAQQEVTA